MAIQFGKAIGIYAKAVAREHLMHADVAAFGAPSECHGLVSKGEARRLREARHHAKSVSGLSRREFNKRWGRLPGKLFADVVNRMYEKAAYHG